MARQNDPNRGSIRGNGSGLDACTVTISGTLPITSSRDTGPLDVSAAWTEDHQFLTVAVVNPTPDRFTLTLDLQNAQVTGAGRWWRVASPDPLIYNEPGQPPRVVIEEQPLPTRP